MPRISLRPPAVDEINAERFVLRDGSAAGVRLATAADAEAMRRFFREQSPESRRQRFLAVANASDRLIDRLCDSSDPSQMLTLVVSRVVDGAPRLIAIGSYAAVAANLAEVAFAVEDRFQGKGLATALLERLAAVAVVHSFTRFQATTFADNAPMLAVFRDSGFEIRSKSADGCIDVQLSLTPSFESVTSAEERRRLAAAASLGPMLAPRSVAIIGASRSEAGLGHRILTAMAAAGFHGPIYPINPAASNVGGRRAYPTVRQVGAPIDLAIVAVPRDIVPVVVDDCAAAGVTSIVVITAGFAETDETGLARQEQLVTQVRGHGMRMVGPNCMGLLNTRADVRLNASFSPVFPPCGHLALSSQSGALGLAIIKLAAERKLGLSTFVSIGNKADVSSNDLLEYWEGDEATRVILLYLESFGNPRRFARLARRIGRQKPIVVVKAGRTRAGSRAAGSHTAALAASDVAVDAVFHQSGVIRAGTIDEMFDIAACLDAQPLPAGRRVAIVTNAGGPGILAVDACESAGLHVVEFGAATRSRLAALLPSVASVGNPVDMIASAGAREYRHVVEAALAAEETDALIVIYTPVDPSRAPDVLAAIRDGIAAGRATGGGGKPILGCLMAETGHPSSLEVNEEIIPTYAFPENAAQALAKIATYAAWRTQPPGLFWGFDDARPDEARTICEQALARHEEWLSDADVRGVLSAYNLPLAAGAVAHSADEAAALAAVVGFPVAAKLTSRRIQHKSDIGAVKLNLSTDHAVRKAFQDIVTRAREVAPTDGVDGVLIQPMIVGGVETMVGVTDDPFFGPLVGFGLGGVHVELLGDVQFKVAPLTDRDADDLVHGIRGFRLLQGYRGHPPADVEALHEILLRVSALAEHVPEIAELDLNPVIALPPGNGCRIVDARIRVRRPQGLSASVPAGLPSAAVLVR